MKRIEVKVNFSKALIWTRASKESTVWCNLSQRDSNLIRVCQKRSNYLIFNTEKQNTEKIRLK
jgi:hypothetical protein